MSFDENSMYWTSNKYSSSYAQYVKPFKSEFGNVSVTELLKIRGIKQF